MFDPGLVRTFLAPKRLVVEGDTLLSVETPEFDSTVAGVAAADAGRVDVDGSGGEGEGEGEDVDSVRDAPSSSRSRPS